MAGLGARLEQRSWVKFGAGGPTYPVEFVAMRPASPSGQTQAENTMRLRQIPLAACIAGILGAPAAGSAAQLDDYLNLSLEDLLSLEVSSVSKKRESLQGAAAAVYVISSEDIRRSGATSIPELLRGVPGVNVAQINSRSWAVSVRGFLDQRADKLLVLMDGRTLYSPLWGGVNWDVQQTVMEDIERIEIIRGPGATVWGANAVNGVINIITKSAADTSGTLLSGVAGGEARADLAARHGAKLGDDTHYRVFARGFERDNASVDDGREATDAWDYGQFGFRADRASGVDRFTLEGAAYAMRADARSFNGSLQAPAADLTYEEQRDRGAHLLARWERSEGDDESQSVQFFVDRSERIEARLEDQITTYDIEYQHRLAPIEDHDLVWGLGYRRISDRTDGSYVVSLTPAHRDDDLYSAFVQDEIRLLPGEVSLTLGSKLEHNDYTGWEAQPSARLAWTPDERSTWWGSVSRAVHTPTRYIHDALLQLATATPGGPMVIRFEGSEEVQSEDLVAWELGYRKQASDTLRFDAALFYNDYDNMLSVSSAAPTCQPSGGTPPCFTPGDTHLEIGSTFLNGYAGHTYGGELTVNWQAADWWRLTGSYSTLRMDLRAKSATSGDGQSLENSPRHQVAVDSSMKLGERTRLDAQLRYVDELVGRGIDSYTELDLRLAWQPTDGMEVSLAGRNLLNEQHGEFVSQENGSDSVEIERSVHAGLRWEF
jgi:iron complex outermembrane receptor protein